MNVRTVARAALYAALYAALTLAPGLNSIAYGQVQFRISEGLLAFAAMDGAAVPGLTIGTALGNIGSPMGLVDIVAGAALTLLAATIMWYVGPRWAALIVPAVVNGFGVAAELALVLHLPYWPSVAFVACGEVAVMATLGALLLSVAKRNAATFGLQPRLAGRPGRAAATPK